MMACDTEWRAVGKNLADDIVSECALFIVVSCVLRLVLCLFFINLVGVLASVELRDTTEYALMEFAVLSLLTISSNTGFLSEFKE